MTTFAVHEVHSGMHFRRQLTHMLCAYTLLAVPVRATPRIIVNLAPDLLHIGLESQSSPTSVAVILYLSILLFGRIFSFAYGAPCSLLRSMQKLPNYLITRK